jgi:hypothetical protein
LLDVQECSNAREQTLAEGRVASDDMCVFALLDIFDEERGVVLWETLYTK